MGAEHQQSNPKQPFATLFADLGKYINKAKVYNHQTFDYVYLFRYKNTKNYVLSLKSISKEYHDRLYNDYDDAVEAFRTTLAHICGVDTKAMAALEDGYTIHSGTYDNFGNSWCIVEDEKDSRYFLWEMCFTLKKVRCEIACSTKSRDFAFRQLDALVERSGRDLI